MQNVALIGIDLGKHSFHIHCQDQSGNALVRILWPDVSATSVMKQNLSLRNSCVRLSKVIRMILLMQKPYAKRLHDHQCVLSSPEQKPSRQ